MALLKAGNLELEVRYHKYYHDCEWIDYCFEPRLAGLPMLNPLVNEKGCKDARYICCNIWGEDDLIPFLEKLLTEKRDAEWDQSPERDIVIKAETWQSRREEKQKEWEGKSVWVSDEGDGELKQEPYAETMQLFAPILEAFLDLTICFNRRYFKGETNFWESGSVCLKLHLSYETLEAFLNELKAEYTVFCRETGCKSTTGT